MRRPLFSITTVLLIFYVAAFPLATGIQTEGYGQDVRPERVVQTDDTQATITNWADRTRILPFEPDNVLLQINVYSNATAHWRIEYWIRLSDRATVKTFRRFQGKLQDGSTTTTERFYNRTRKSIEAAESATGRKMSGTDFRTHTTIRRIPQKYGVVVHSFRWQGFATVSDQRLRVGDALEGLFLGSGERLLISWPDRYVLATVDPEPDVTRDTTVIWRGPTVFGLDGPQLLLIEQSRQGSQLLPIGTFAIIIALVAVLAWARHDDRAPLASLAARVFDDSSDELELLSNEEQVIRLVEQHGGRVKQQKVAEELGWTTSKTSYVVSSLRKEDRIQTFRLGRENVLSLSDPNATQ